ncbi:hypothetical protein CPCC7001_648 [Cyanobium sp. PCC 7001]|uniref:hypothetical protein n=1 Tax=Cyanobium sp. PCC 7001 TaxID=180281 RepID=UPI0001805D0B|nr:hypothetical protein [Cyanobium sp. PCC 7001]EDY37769.1 hypothetical protein CPCC7001_648 [Cyanobium sp. PCC 7001]
MAFFQVIWHRDGIGDGGDLKEALAVPALVTPDAGDWTGACASPAPSGWCYW